MFDRYFTNVNASYVTTNSYAASKKLVQHLIGMGHRLIAHIGGPQSNAFAKGMLQGYRHVLQKNKIAVHEDLIVSVAMDGSDCIPAFRRILQQKKRPTAIQAVNDPVAIEILKAAKTMGIIVPEDLAVVGFSDSRLSEMLAVPLTTVREPTGIMAAAAVHILVDQIETKSKKKIEKSLPGKIILRRSCGAE